MISFEFVDIRWCTAEAMDGSTEYPTQNFCKYCEYFTDDIFLFELDMLQFICLENISERYWEYFLKYQVG